MNELHALSSGTPDLSTTTARRTRKKNDLTSKRQSESDEPIQKIDLIFLDVESKEDATSNQLADQEETILTIDRESRTSHVSEVFPEKFELDLNYPNFPEAAYETDVAESINICYGDDINIIDIHRFICLNFAVRRRIIPTLERMVEEHLHRSRSSTLTINQRRKYEKLAEGLSEKIKRYKSDQDWNIYVHGVKDILVQYFNNMSQKTRGILYIGKKHNQEKIEVKRHRLQLIFRYIDCLREIINVNVTRNASMRHFCMVCSRPYDENNVEEESDYYACPCGHSFYLMSKEITYHDPHTISPKNIVADDSSNSFLETINKFMGKQTNVNIPKELFGQFDEYLSHHNHPIGSYFLSLPVEKRAHVERIGNTHGTSVSMLINMLKETNNSLFYEDINLIGHLYFGWLLPNLSKWIEDIMVIYRMTKIVYDQYPGKRSSVLNSKIILYFILEYLKIPCSPEDFKLMDTKDSVDNYRESWKIMSTDPDVEARRNKFFREHGIVLRESCQIII